MNPAFRLSIAIPVHNEESVLPELLRRARAVLDHVPGGPHEIIFVDDGSTDRTFPILEEAASQDPRILATFRKSYPNSSLDTNKGTTLSTRSAFVARNPGSCVFATLSFTGSWPASPISACPSIRETSG